MIKRTCLSIALLGCLAAPAISQEYYSHDRSASENTFSTVNFTRAPAAPAVEEASDEAETIALLKEQLKRM